MRTKTVLLAIALASSAISARAAATFVFDVSGSGVYAAGGTEGCSPSHPDECLHDTDWRGVLTVQTVSDADGSYNVGGVVDNEWVPGGIVRVALSSNVGGTDIDAQAFPGAQYFPDSFPYEVTIVDHRIASIQWYSEETPDGSGNLHIDDFNVQFFSDAYHDAYADVRGTLTAVPEPCGIALSLLGLATVGLAVRRRGVSPAPGSSPAASTPSGN
jgi:hypothetical protein